MKKYYCYECNKEVNTDVVEVEETYKVKSDIDITAKVKKRVCKVCGSDISDVELDDKTLHDIYAKYKEVRGFLSSEEIKEIREKSGLTAEELSLKLGWFEKAIGRYERGCVQSKEHDEVLRNLHN